MKQVNYSISKKANQLFEQVFDKPPLCILERYPHIFWTLHVNDNRLSVVGRLICEKFPLPNHKQYWLHPSERYIERRFEQRLAIDLTIMTQARFMTPNDHLEGTCSRIADNLVEEAKRLVAGLLKGRLPS